MTEPLPFQLHQSYRLSELMRYSQYFHYVYTVERDGIVYSVIETYSYQYVFENMPDWIYLCVESQKLDGQQ